LPLQLRQPRRHTSASKRPYCPAPPASAPAFREIAKTILERSGIPAGSGYQLGVSKVFLRAGHMAVLDKQRTGEGGERGRAAVGRWGAAVCVWRLS
jgi:hypothetical protein